MRSTVTDRVAWSVTLVSPAKTTEPIEMPFGLRTRLGLGNHVLDGGPDPPMGRGNIEGGKGRPIVKYRNTAIICVKKKQNRSRCRLGCGLGWPQGIVLRWGPDTLREGAISGETCAHSKG